MNNNTTATDPSTTSTPVADDVFTIDLPTYLLPAMQDKIDKANRKASRNGMGEPFGMTIVSTWEKTKKVGGVNVSTPWVTFVITGENAGLPGWSYAAKVTWDTELPVVNTSPFYSGPVLPRPASKHCDHCGTTRSRTNTHLVIDPDGNVKQVGGNCLTVFTGIPVGWVSMSEGLVQNEDDLLDYWGGKIVWTFGTSQLLEFTIRIVDALGYVPTSSDDVSTKQRFLIAWTGRASSEWEQKIKFETEDAMLQRHHTDEEVAAEVAAIIAWADTLAGAPSDYLQNLHAILAGKEVSERNLGYALSAVSAFRKDRAKVAARVAVTATRTPVVEGRQVIVGTIESVKLQHSDFGSVVKARITTDSGSVVWGTLPAAISHAIQGNKVTFTATVTASRDDATFGFYSRPSKASIVA